MKELQHGEKNQLSDQNPVLDVQFPNFKKLLTHGRGPQGNLLPPLEEKEASVLTAVSPSYTYRFTDGFLELETTLTESKTNALLSKNFGHSALLLGYGSTWTHFLIALAVSNTKPRLEELVSLQTVELEAKRMALAEEEKMHRDLLLQIKKNGKQLQNLKTSTEQESPPVILCSKLKQAQTYYDKMLQVYDGYEVKGVEDKKKEFKNYVDLCINPAIKRFYQKDLLTPFSQNRIFCKVKDEKNEAYNLRALVKRMMVIHLLEEMSQFLHCIEEYNVHYILHEGTNKRNESHDQLIKILITMFLPDRIGLGYLQNIVFTPVRTIKPAKDLVLKSDPTLTQSLLLVSAPNPKPTEDAIALSPKYDEDIALSLDFNPETTEMKLSSRTEILHDPIVDLLHDYIMEPLIKLILPMIIAFTEEPKTRELLLASVGKKDLATVDDLRVKRLNGLYKESSTVQIVLDLIVETLSLGEYFDYVVKYIREYHDALEAKDISSEMKSVLNSDKGPKPPAHKLHQTSQNGTHHSNNMHLMMSKVKRSKSVPDLLRHETASSLYIQKPYGK